MQEDLNLKATKEEITTFGNEHGGIYSIQEHKDDITSLLAKRSQILKDQEESWHIRRKSIWFFKGDDNTKFYHKFANGCKAINTTSREKQ